MTKPHRQHRAPDLTAKHKAPLPRARLAAQPFCFDSATGRLVAPWPRHVLWQDEEATLCAVIDQITAYGAALRVPCWIWPDGRAPMPVQNPDPRWLGRWSEGKAVYIR